MKSMLMKSFVAGACLAAMLSAATDTRLSEAAMQGDRDQVRALLGQRVDVDAPQGDGTTALHWAAFKNDVDMVKMLLAAGANVKAETQEEALTPLFMACTNGNATIIGLLLRAGADPNTTNANGTTALMTAAASGSVDAVKALLDHGADPNLKETTRGQTALMFAAALNRDGVIRELLAHKADPNLTSKVNTVKRVRFDQDGNIVDDAPGAGRGGGRGAARASGGGRGTNEKSAATASGADKPAGAIAQAKPLSVKEQDAADVAADAAKAAAAAKAANETAKADLDTFAQALGLKSVLFSLAKPKTQAGDVASRAPQRKGPATTGGMTALLYAAREGNVAAVKALVEGGADINEVSAEKFSPMVMAIQNGHLDLGKYFLEHGADPKLASSSGLTALYAVIDVQWAPHAWFPQPSLEQEKTRYLDLMEEMIAHGADVNAQLGEKLWFRSFTNDATWVDPSGATAFWRAAQSSDTVAMRLLVAHGADPNIKSRAGDTPLMAAAGIGWVANWSVNGPEPLINAVKYCVELGNDVNAADTKGYTALHGAAYMGDNEVVKFLVSKGARVNVSSTIGDTVADFANGPTRFGQPHLDTMALLEQLGSKNSHNCRSDMCVIATGQEVCDGSANCNLASALTKEEQADKELLDTFAVALGFNMAIYKNDAPVRKGYPGQH